MSLERGRRARAERPAAESGKQSGTQKGQTHTRTKELPQIEAGREAWEAPHPPHSQSSAEGSAPSADAERGGTAGRTGAYLPRGPRGRGLGGPRSRRRQWPQPPPRWCASRRRSPAGRVVVGEDGGSVGMRWVAAHCGVTRRQHARNDSEPKQNLSGARKTQATSATAATAAAAAGGARAWACCRTSICAAISAA